MTTVLHHPTTTAETSMHPLSAGTALHANLRRDTEHPVADARLIAAAFAHQHQLPEDTVDDLVQIVDALTVNAIKHAIWPDEHATVELTLTRIGDAILIDVEDPDFRNMPIWRLRIRQPGNVGSSTRTSASSGSPSSPRVLGTKP